MRGGLQTLRCRLNYNKEVYVSGGERKKNKLTVACGQQEAMELVLASGSPIHLQLVLRAPIRADGTSCQASQSDRVIPLRRAADESDWICSPKRRGQGLLGRD